MVSGFLPSAISAGQRGEIQRIVKGGHRSMQNQSYRNPIISGYNPDPSICRVGDDYYIVNSSFEYFPGVPVYHSRNLVNWELLGHCLTTDEQLPLEKCRPSGGIFAPTLRYHDGWFFMTTTNVSSGGNFIVHSKEPDKGWSDPVRIDQGGIDPSLLFDDDGKVYFTSAADDEEGRSCILICELDPFTGEKFTESKVLSYGCGGRYPEGPHLYKVNGKYYLMLAEGGTEYGHMETIQRADHPYGPYEPCPHNPILSHKEDMREKIYCTGHADLMEDANGNWWMVCLAIRPCGGENNRVLLHNLGRETYLAPVVWTEDGWPVVGDHGLIDLEMEGPLPGKAEPVCRDFTEDFSGDAFSTHYNFLRNPDRKNYVRMPEEKKLLLKGTQITLNDQDSPTWVGVRQKGFDTITTLRLRPLGQVQGMRVGLSAYYNHDYHYEIYLTRELDRWKVCLAKHVHDIFAVTSQMETELSADGSLWLRIVTDRENYTFLFSTDGENYVKLGTGLTVGLCTESTRTMTFTGTYLAMFAERADAEVSGFEIKVLDM